MFCLVSNYEEAINGKFSITDNFKKNSPTIKYTSISIKQCHIYKSDIALFINIKI